MSNINKPPCRTQRPMRSFNAPSREWDEQLAAVAASTGVSVSAYIREAVDEHMQKQQEQETNGTT
jgi:predicted DNA-binding protein